MTIERKNLLKGINGIHLQTIVFAGRTPGYI